ncbi:unnamed protein product, partial [Rhizoctonia solani]
TPKPRPPPQGDDDELPPRPPLFIPQPATKGGGKDATSRQPQPDEPAAGSSKEVTWPAENNMGNFDKMGNGKPVGEMRIKRPVQQSGAAVRSHPSPWLQLMSLSRVFDSIWTLSSTFGTFFYFGYL